MGAHPINLGIRFLLELAALASMAYWGGKQSDGGMKYVFMFAIPIIAAAMWGTFAVADDPSRSGSAPIPVPGLLRLILELSFFGVATWMLFDLKQNTYSILIGSITIVHYIISYDRIAWLLSN